jgi:DNA-directed RNA polymerase specialized sigma24 family protein
LKKEVKEVALPKQDPQPLGQEKALSALVALMAAEREERIESSGNGARPTEVILADAGLSNNEIAGLLDKKRDTVQKTIQRARKPSGRKRRR